MRFDTMTHRSTNFCAVVLVLVSLVDVSGTAVAAVTEAEFIAGLRASLKLTQDHELIRETNQQSVISSDRVVRYRHVFRGIDVLDAGLNLRLRNDRVLSHHAQIRPDLDINVVPHITRVDARAIAEQRFARMSGLPDEKVVFNADQSGCTLGIESRAIDRRSRPQLLYRCRLVSRTAAYVIDIDAASGDYITTAPLRLEAWVSAPATGETVHHGLVGPFDAQVDENGNYRLQATTHKTYDMEGGPLVPIDDENKIFTTASLPFVGSNKPGVSVHFALERALGHYAHRFGVDPLGGKKPVPYLSAFVNVDHRGSYYDPVTTSILVFGLKEADWVAFDVISHEVAHRLADTIDNGGDHTGEFGALHESYADILAQLAEEATFGSTDWIVADELKDELGAKRNLLDPSKSKVSYNNNPVTQQPDVYHSGPYWLPVALPYDETNDWGGIHVNNSIPNRWFTLLAQGGTGTNTANVSYSVEPIGSDTAAIILYMYLLESLQPNAGFYQARQASEQAASDLCGEMSQARLSVINAWHAVGVEPNPVPSLPLASPFQGQTGVDPWPVRLSWQAKVSIDEPGWTVQIGTDPNFPSPNNGTWQMAAATKKEMENGIEVGVLDTLNLQPSTTYYWRVRQAGSAPGSTLSCWRPVMSFTTADQIPLLHAPHTNGTYHPWSLPFVMTLPDGALWVDIEVAHDSNFTDKVFPTKTFPIDVDNHEPDWDARLHVPKNQEVLFWRARTRHDEGRLSEWSQTMDFTTIDPKVVNAFPSTGTAIYPWNASFGWVPLPGTAKYRVHTHPSISGPNTYVHTTALLSFNAARLADQKQHEWFVQAYGPPLGSDLEPEPPDTSELSQASDPWTIVIDGDATEVQLIKPAWSPGTNSM